MAEPIQLNYARTLLGIGEIVGTVHEPKVVAFFADAGVPEIKDDETAWCGAFMAAVWAAIGRPDVRPPGDRYNALRARQWLNVGRPVDKPLPGDIAVFERGGKNARTGHVAFVAEDRGDKIQVLGGNQSNKVTLALYAKDRVLGYRRVDPLPAPVRNPPPISIPIKPKRKWREAVAAFFAAIFGGPRNG